METDIGNPIDYDPTVDPLNKNNEKNEDSTPINDQIVQDFNKKLNLIEAQRITDSLKKTELEAELK